MGNPQEDSGFIEKMIKEIDREEKYFFMMLSESSLKRTWDNPYDKKWDDLL